MVGVAASAVTLAASNKTAAAKTPRTHDIVIKSFTFEPQSVTVQVGDTIRWTNEDLAPHTATASEAGWDTGELAKGQSATILVTHGMQTSYFCAFHPHMKGTIEVV